MSSEPPLRVLLLFAKAPRAGLCKTRLVLPPIIDAESVARLADAFLRDTVRAIGGLARTQHQISYTPADAAPYFEALDPTARLACQVDGPFGQRIAGAFDAAFAAGAQRVVLVGADTPHLESKRMERAFAALEDHEIVLGPCADGGYYLLGMRRPCPRLFEDIEWSTARVRGQTLERAAEAGLSVCELEVEFDVDEPADLLRLQQLVLQAGSERCPHTARLLAGWSIEARSGGQRG
jgi:rSAM/selenodomain-associated transferase 1